MKRKLILSAAAALAFAPIVGPVLNINNAIEIQAQVQQGAQLVALGGSLDSQQGQETLQLLGAGQIDPSNIVYIDGTTINRFLQDGSGPETVVFSSAFLQSMPEGYGVQVQIVTPQNILEVSPTTYQNAAITAGASNVQIKVATVEPVTGEGALAGVYALLEQQGVSLSQHDIQVAQKEITLVNEINQNENTAISDAQINQMMAEIKQEITRQITEGNAEPDISAIVNSVADKYDLSDEAIIASLIEFAEEFAKTEAAQNENTIDELDQSIQGEWIDVLTSLTESVEPTELLNQDRPDYSDASVYHPILQAFSNEMFRIIEANEVIDSVYNDTFIFEAMTPEMSNSDKKALNELRTTMYQYAANNDARIQSGEIQAGYNSTKEYWINNIYTFANLRVEDLAMSEMIMRLALASGRSPQVYDYTAVSQEGTVITFENRWFSPEGHQADFIQYTFDLANDSMTKLDYLTGEMIELGGSYDFSIKYGQAVENNYYSQLLIPEEYTIPGYIAEDEEEEIEEQAIEEEEAESSEETETSLPEESSLPDENELPVEDSSEETNSEDTDTSN